MAGITRTASGLFCSYREYSNMSTFRARILTKHESRVITIGMSTFYDRVVKENPRIDRDVERGLAVGAAGFAVDGAVSLGAEVPVHEIVSDAATTSIESIVGGVAAGWLGSRFTRLPVGLLRAGGAAAAIGSRIWQERHAMPITTGEWVELAGNVALAGAMGYAGATAITNAK